MPKRLSDLNFTDLYLEKQIEAARIRGIDAGAGLQPPPDDLLEDLRRLYSWVDQHAKNAPGMHEFAVPYDDVMYRVAVIDDVRGKVFALRRGATRVPALRECGIAPPVVAHLLGLRSGLVLVSGGFGAGKTTTAAAFVREFTHKGGLSVTLEDPPELPLSGDHGAGRCFQIMVDRRKIDEEVEGTLRMAFDLLFISEIRTAVMADEVIKASINGKLIISTIHADSAVNAVQRLMNLASDLHGTGGERAVRDMLGSGLAAVVYMAKMADANIRAASEYLIGGDEVRAKIASGEIQGLRNTVNTLRNRLAMGHGVDGARFDAARGAPATAADRRLSVATR